MRARVRYDLSLILPAAKVRIAKTRHSKAAVRLINNVLVGQRLARRLRYKGLFSEQPEAKLVVRCVANFPS